MDSAFDTTRFAALLEGLGKSFGLPGLAPDAHGGCLLMFDEVVVTMQQDAHGEQLTVHAEIGRLAPDASKARLEALLASNLFWARTGGATLSLLPANRSLLLARRFDLEHTSVGAFEAALKEFLDAAELWREQLAMPEPREDTWDSSAAMAALRA